MAGQQGMVGRAIARRLRAADAEVLTVGPRRARSDRCRRKAPSVQRPWNTSLPRETLLSTQQSLHNYTYRGVPMLKNPFDLALYLLLLRRLKPRTVIEIGSKSGGSGL